MNISNRFLQCFLQCNLLRLLRRARFVALLVVVAITGCVNASVQEIRQGASGMVSTDAIAILGRRQGAKYETEADFVACVGKELAGQNVRVIPEQEFIDGLFPWFEPKIAPMDPSQLPRILSQPVLAAKLKKDGVRYLVWVDGVTNYDSNGVVTCSLSPTGVGCFGFFTVDKNAVYEASVWDINRLTSIGKISSEATGTDYYPTFVVPIPIVARVQGQACDGLASRLHTFLGEAPTASAVLSAHPN